jgi:hypothetical protein
VLIALAVTAPVVIGAIGGDRSGGDSSGGDSSGALRSGFDGSGGDSPSSNVDSTGGDRSNDRGSRGNSTGGANAGSNHADSDQVSGDVDNYGGYISGDKSGNAYSGGVRFVDNTECNYLVGTNGGDIPNVGDSPGGCTLAVTRSQAIQQVEKQTTENSLISCSDVNVKSLSNHEETNNAVTRSNVFDLDVVRGTVQSQSDVDSTADTHDSSYIGVQFSDNDTDSLSGDTNNLRVTDTIGVDITREQLIALQQSDPSLEHVRSALRKESPSTETGYFLHNGIITRRYFSSSEAKQF